MKFTRRGMVLLMGSALAAAALLPLAASARTHVFLGVTLGGFVPPPPVVYGPPVYYAPPPPAYYAPYYAPRVVYETPRPVYYYRGDRDGDRWDRDRDRGWRDGDDHGWHRGWHHREGDDGDD